jgi:glycosyltransferase involved in cell wall biosynthesis
LKKIISLARKSVGRTADLCVFPNQKRLEAFLAVTGRAGPTELVWNVPSVEEVGPSKSRPPIGQPMRLFYGGSLSPERLPWSVLEEIWALKGRVNLDIVGYPNYEDRDFPEKIKHRDGNRGTVRYHGAVPRRGDLFRVMDPCEVALCLMPLQSSYAGMQTMAGASNKPFDAMARGLAVVVSDLEEWRKIYLGIGDRAERIGESPFLRIPEPEKGYGIAINPESRESIRAGLEWMLKNRDKLWEMGERGRQKIQSEWNYERAFSPVFKKLESWE